MSIVTDSVFIKSVIDLTTLEGSDTPERVLQLCTKAKQQHTAAVCVYPTFARLVRQSLSGTHIKTACVAGAFPAGQSPIQIKIAEVAYAVQEGAQEIDMVISRGTFLTHDYNTVGEEIKAIKTACGAAHLKVILETGELQSPQNIRLASEIAIANGADFIKTSTGKIAVSATPEAVQIMTDVIKQYYEQTGRQIGIKVAGGVSTIEEALRYIGIVQETVGDAWLNPSLFRIGASRLLDRL
ncbi:deoxyribose-phosphate aldolase [Bacteroidia bacterium]|nr:deoxyribose-phosphate aldolase [Bacteroidia bacterium]